MQKAREFESFSDKQTIDKVTKDDHLRLFRPNLENPANKQATIDLNNKEQSRCQDFMELIDDT